MALAFLAAAGVGLAVYAYSGSVETMETLEQKKAAARPSKTPGYNPYILNQFQTMADTIFSADMRENDIHSKPDKLADGIYGITEHHVRLNPADPLTVVTSKANLNV
jgi:hypothetical protein